MNKYYVEVVVLIDGNLKKFEDIFNSKNSLTAVTEFLHFHGIKPETVDKIQVTNYTHG